MNLRLPFREEYEEPAKKKNKPQNKVWSEKHRPKFIRQIIGNEHIKKMLQKSLQDGNLPHLLFHGPPGTGKTSTIIAFARELFGIKLFKKRVFMLNASDERGIDIVREKIKNLSKAAVNNSCYDKRGKLIPPFKLIILDEADSMTKDAQCALRKDMEINLSVTRFVFICNYKNKIIDAIESRCASIRFAPLKYEETLNRALLIIKKENITIKKKHLKIIIEHSFGDMRKTIQYLQHLQYEDNITTKIINDICGIIPKQIIENISNVIIFSNGARHSDILKLATDIKHSGHSGIDIVHDLCIVILFCDKIDDKIKAKIIIKIGQIEHIISQGNNTYDQLKYLFGQINIYLHPNIFNELFLKNKN
jgi:replication factor C subunit 2/4